MPTAPHPPPPSSTTPPARRRGGSWQRSSAVVGLSALLATGLHLGAGVGAWLVPVKNVQTLHKTEWHNTIRIGGQAPEHQRVELAINTFTPPPVTPMPPEPEPEPEGQVVSLPRSDDPPPTAADYLASTNHRTERETRARITGVAPNISNRPMAAEVGQQAADVAVPSPATEERPLQEVADPTEGGPAGDGKGTEGDAIAWDSAIPASGAPQLALALPRIEDLQGLQKTPTSEGTVPVRPQREGRAGTTDEALALALGRAAPLATAFGNGVVGGGVGFSRRGGSGSDGRPGRGIFFPNLSTLEQRSGLPRSDHLLVEEDDATSLNAFEYRYATFFSRVHDAIARTWRGSEVMRAVDPSGRVYGNFDQVTAVAITINQEGEVVDIALQQASSAEPYDDEAIRAVRAASPFRNPPRGLFRGNDRFTFQFGFHLDYSRRSMDLNWAPY